jgi:hypothetical protein
VGRPHALQFLRAGLGTLPDRDGSGQCDENTIRQTEGSSDGKRSEQYHRSYTHQLSSLFLARGPLGPRLGSGRFRRPLDRFNHRRVSI